MAEQTLGRRIMIEATICKDAPPGSAMAGKAWADLRALCARADAAERLAVVSRAYWRASGAYDASEDSAEWEDLLEAMDRSREDLDNALADWRVLGEVARGE